MQGARTQRLGCRMQAVSALASGRHRKAMLFVDNAGADVVLGMLPLARELLRSGAEVLLCCNSLPSVNDITAPEMEQLLPRVADADAVLASAISSDRLRVVADGNDLPVIDLRRVSQVTERPPRNPFPLSPLSHRDLSGPLCVKALPPLSFACKDTPVRPWDQSRRGATPAANTAAPLRRSSWTSARGWTSWCWRGWGGQSRQTCTLPSQWTCCALG